MSDLQLALIALGAVFVAGVAGYNALQERRARRRAEAAFRGGHPDA
ncbi:MAG: cell division protein, partial [Betaproteobacteria bacterium]